jgi:pimeloyl-ACP methyl ester carboxylesterase
MKKVFCYFFPLLLVLSSCSQKQETTDPETITKDDAFRSRITSGKFAKLSAGYTYYEFSSPSSDTILVLVHGFSVPSYIWDSTYNDAVLRGYATLRYDTYGRGLSDAPDVAYDVALFAQQLKELLDALQITKPINLAGLSDGGRTISAFAFQYPERVHKLIYVDAAGFDNPTRDGTASAMVTEEEVLQFKQSERYQTMAAGQLSDFYDSVPFRGWDKKYQEVMKYKGFVRALISTSKNRASLENEHRKIAASGIPVFAIWGENDMVVKLEEVRPTMLERLPKLQLFVIPKTGHLPQMENAGMFSSILFDQIVRGKK